METTDSKPTMPIASPATEASTSDGAPVSIAMCRQTLVELLVPLRSLGAPAELAERAAHVPLRIAYDGFDEVFSVEPDFASVFNAGADRAQTHGSLLPATAQLLYKGAEEAASDLRFCVEGIIGSHGLFLYACSSVDFEFLTALLPEAVVEWLRQHPLKEAGAWVLNLATEIYRHALTVMLGDLPEPKTVGSEVALWMMLEAAEARFSALMADRPDEWWAGFVGAGGHERSGGDLAAVRELLYPLRGAVSPLVGLREVASVAALPKSSSIHPAKWFDTF